MPIVNSTPPVRQPSKWRPMAERDAAYWITIHTYACRIPNMQTMSPEYIKFMGMPSSGDPDVDRQMRNELIEVRWTIGQMAEAHHSGVQVSVRDPRQTKEMYERITTLLREWKEVLEYSVNPGKVPADDLMKLDTFASALFPHARPFFERNFIDSKLAAHMGGILSISRGSFFEKATPAPTVEERQQKANEERHRSFSDVFKDHKTRLVRQPGGSRWK